jgi:NAD(P)-dependent dehydrogenase (short-subunit alcohol dehydrogenase family)
MTRLEGKVAVVTGAAGGIGQATAIALHREGATVAVLDRRLNLLDRTIELCRDGRGAVLPLAVDQTDRAEIEVGVDAVLAELGPIDILFANAGYGKFSSFLDQPEAEWSRHVNVNLTGTFHVAQLVARAMVAQQKGGAIVVNTSSGAAQHADLLSAYCATKAALRMLVVGMASELGVHRIRVNAVMPGVIETGMTSPMLESDPRHREVLLAETPVGRLGRPEDVANLVTFLVSEEASFITGQALMIDGGQTIHGHPRWFRTDYRNAFVEDWEVGR